MDDKHVFVNVNLMSEELVQAITANRKLTRKVRGLKGWVFGLIVTCVAIIAELAERKRCEKYLQKQIDNLKGKVDDELDDDPNDFQSQLNDIEDRVNDLTWTVKNLEREVSDGGARDA